MKKQFSLATAIVVAGLMIAVSASNAIQLQTPEEKTLNLVKREKIDHFMLTKHPLSDTLTKEKTTLSNGNRGNLPIITTDYDCQDPTIATDGTQILVMAEEAQEIFESDLMMIYSDDGGDSWGSLFTYPWPGSEESKPALDYCENSEMEGYGTAIPDPNEMRFHLLHFPGLTDETKVWEDDDGWTPWGFDISGYYEDFEDIDVCGFPHGEDVSPYPSFHGIILASCVDLDTGLDTFILAYETTAPSVQLLYMPGVQGDIGQVACDADASTGYYYEAVEWANEPDWMDDGVWFDHKWLEPGNPDWWRGDWYGYKLEGAHNPDVAADSGNTYCVCEVDGEIVCFYSHDDLETLEYSNVSTEGQFPSVAAIGDYAICTYYYNGDLYTRISEDAGVNWEDPFVINDESGSAPARDHGADNKGSFVVWTDNRNAPPTEVYFDFLEIGNAPGAPTITGETSGTAGKEYEYTFNAIDEDGDDVKYIIDWDDDNIETTGFNSSGTDVEVSHTWADEGEYTIRAKAQDTTGLTGPEGTLTVTMPRNRAINNPFLNFLQNHPNLFSILRYLLGL